MRCIFIHNILLKQVTLIVALFFSLSVSPTQVNAKSKRSLPPFSKVQSVVKRHISMIKNHEPGDLITSSDVKVLFRQLKILGWNMSEKKKIYNSILSDGDFLAQQLRSTHGRKLMRKISSDPKNYDRLDRLTNMPGGKRMVHDLMRLPDAEKLFTESKIPGRRDLTQLLPKGINGKTPKSTEFEKPTGRIYTFKQFTTKLQKSYLKDKKKLAKLNEKEK